MAQTVQAPKHLFKYQPYSTKAIENLKNRQIWFSAPARFNDPYDRLRMEKVRHLLATSFLSIKQIMALVSYSNRKDFVRQFKRHFDLTPSEYRKRRRHPVTFNGGN